MNSRVKALQEAAFALAYLLSESLFDKRQLGERNLHSCHNSALCLRPCYHSRLIRQISWQVLHLILALALVGIELEFDIYWLQELDLQEEFLLHLERQLHISCCTVFMGQLDRVLVQDKVVLFIEYLILKRGVITFSLLLVYTENTLFNEYLGKFDPIKQIEVLEECEHLTSGQMVRHCRFEKLLFIFSVVNIRNRR